MKNLIKRIISKLKLSSSQYLNRIFSDYTQNEFYSSKQFKDLEVLKCTISYNKFGGYCVPLSSCHRPAASKILSNEVYESQTIEFIVSNCANGDVIHAGTYFGDFLPAISNAISTGSKVWAFEPNRENYQCAKITLLINGSENVILTNAGLGSKSEELFIQTIDKNGLSLGGASRIISKDFDEVTLKEKIQIVTIDQIIDTEIIVSIIQLDVEGYEKEALAGALQTIKRCHPIIILEVLQNSTLIRSHWFLENILSLGYRKLIDIQGNSIYSCKN